jgi:hypothetical protein
MIGPSDLLVRKVWLHTINRAMSAATATVLGGRTPMEIVIIIFLIICVIWLAMKVRNRAEESDEAALANAWRDPNYKEPRPLEERKHTAEGQVLTLGEAARETSQS